MVRIKAKMLYARTPDGDHDLKVNGKKIIKTICGLQLTPQKRRPYKWLYTDWKKRPCQNCDAFAKKAREDAMGYGTVSGFTDFETL